MATTAALPTPVPTIDLGAPNTFAVRLGSSVTKSASSAGGFSSVRYNYKPDLKDEGDVECRLLPGEADPVRLALTSEGGREWEYTGSRVEEKGRYVLVLSLGEGKREAVLERLGGMYGMEITKTPEGAVKEGTYPSLPEQGVGEGEGGLFGGADDEDQSADPDPDNPFDYRHFLRAAEAKARKDRADAQQAADRRSAAGTPTLNGRAPAPAATKAAKATPATTAAKKRKTPASAPKPNPKRVQAGRSPPPHPKPQIAAPKPATQPSPPRNDAREIPEVRLDRLASSAGFSSPTQPAEPSVQGSHKDDDGELILENESPATSKHPRAMGLALSGQLGGSKSGPRSLRSAASMSPASRVQSPRVEEQGEREYEFEFGGDDDEDEHDGDDDEDVEALKLGSPAQQRRQDAGGADVAVEDDEDDMEAQLALAMAQEDEEPVAPARVEESEEDVSEEE